MLQELRSLARILKANQLRFPWTLSADQCRQIMAMLSAEMMSSDPPPSHAVMNSASFIAGTRNTSCLLPSHTSWILDSGASRHICPTRSLFSTSTAPLPNHTTIAAYFCGYIKLNNDFVLRKVLYVPSFQFNLLSVSVLTLCSNLVVFFSNNGFIIQDVLSRKWLARVSCYLNCT